VARAAAVLQLGLRGTPFLYAGDELGLEDAVIPPERKVDPGGRDGCRAPVPWERADGHGWGPAPWLPFPPEASSRSVEAQVADEQSVLWLFKRLLAARKASPALVRGTQRMLDAGAGVLAWERVDPGSGDRRVVLVSMAGADGMAQPLDGLAEGMVVDVASDGPDGEGEPLAVLAPGRAVWLKPS
jgi:alpha-glucosidase